MKYIKEYLCDGKTPSNKEIIECLDIVQKEKLCYKTNMVCTL